MLADRKMHVVDDGFGATSAMEIASKLASREMAWKAWSWCVASGEKFSVGFEMF